MQDAALGSLASSKLSPPLGRSVKTKAWEPRAIHCHGGGSSSLLAANIGLMWRSHKGHEGTSGHKVTHHLHVPLPHPRGRTQAVWKSGRALTGVQSSGASQLRLRSSSLTAFRRTLASSSWRSGGPSVSGLAKGVSGRQGPTSGSLTAVDLVPVWPRTILLRILKSRLGKSAQCMQLESENAASAWARPRLAMQCLCGSSGSMGPAQIRQKLPIGCSAFVVCSDPEAIDALSALYTARRLVSICM